MRKELATPGDLPPLPDFIPAQASPFVIPPSLQETISALHKPLDDGIAHDQIPELPSGAESAHPFSGGSKPGQARIRHLIESGAMSGYKDTRNGLLGLDFSTKLSAWLAMGCITARQVHWRLTEFEDGSGELGRHAAGFGKGENKGTAAVRFELLWRDYMRLCTRKFGVRLFSLTGYRQDARAAGKFRQSPFASPRARSNPAHHHHGKNDDDDDNTDPTRHAVLRFLAGRTGTGLISTLR